MSATRKRRTGLRDEEPLLGAHVSTAGGVACAIDRARAIGCTAMQIFVKNNMQWFAKPLDAAEVRAFREHPLRDSLRSVFGHSGYLINLAASDPALHERSMRSLREELVRANRLGLPFLVLHPGAHMGRGVEAGLEKVVASLDAIYGVIPEAETRIALETTAGQGSSLGRTFEELAFILCGCREPERFCVCIDTAHLFAAGYDLGSDEGIMRTFAQFKRLIGFKRLAAIHMNDSKPQPVRAWTVMNTSAKEKSGWTHSGISCASRVSATFPKSSRPPKARTWPRMSSISLRCARSCKNPCIREGSKFSGELLTSSEDGRSGCAPGFAAQSLANA
jgi:deoxyribonuclease-4